jgi:hypothetical protein
MKLLASSTSSVCFVLLAVISIVIVKTDGQETSDVVKGESGPSLHDKGVHSALTVSSGLSHGANGSVLKFGASSNNVGNREQPVFENVGQGSLRKQRDLKGKGSTVPSNDICVNARHVKTDGKVVKGTTVGATVDFDYAPGVWFKLQVATSACVIITMCVKGSFYPELYFEGNSCGATEANVDAFASTITGEDHTNVLCTDQFGYADAGVPYYFSVRC